MAGVAGGHDQARPGPSSVGCRGARRPPQPRSAPADAGVIVGPARFPHRTLAAVAAGVLALVVIVVALAAGGNDGDQRPPATPAGGATSVSTTATVAAHDGTTDDHRTARGRELAELEPLVRARTAWERINQPELDRLRMLDRQIDMSERLERVVSRDLERSVDRGLDRGLGMEL